MNGMAQLNPSWLVLFMSAVAIVPIALSLLTSYLKMSIVFGMVKNALGTQSSPSALTVLALSAALTCFTMGPVLEESIRHSSTVDMKSFVESPSMEKLSSLGTAFVPWKHFLQKHAGRREVMALQTLAQAEPSALAAPQEKIQTGESLRVLVPAFVLTELKEGFAMGFVLLLPFLVIDLIIANILVGLGMTMVSPVMIALPVKLLLFIVSDGWLLLAKGLVLSYQ